MLYGFRYNNWVYTCLFNPCSAKLNNLNFHPLEVVSRYRDPQLQVGENYSYLFILRPNICKSWFLSSHFILNISDLVGLTTHSGLKVIHCQHCHLVSCGNNHLLSTDTVSLVNTKLLKNIYITLTSFLVFIPKLPMQFPALSQLKLYLFCKNGWISATYNCTAVY